MSEILGGIILLFIVCFLLEIIGSVLPAVINLVAFLFLAVIMQGSYDWYKGKPPKTPKQIEASLWLDELHRKHARGELYK